MLVPGADFVIGYVSSGDCGSVTGFYCVGNGISWDFGSVLGDEGSVTGNGGGGSGSGNESDCHVTDGWGNESDCHVTDGGGSGNESDCHVTDGGGSGSGNESDCTGEWGNITFVVSGIKNMERWRTACVYYRYRYVCLCIHT